VNFLEAERHSKTILGGGTLEMQDSKSDVTVAELGIFFDYKLVSPPTEQISKHFDTAMESLNIVLSAYRVLYRDESIHRLLTEMISTKCPFQYVSIPDWEFIRDPGTFEYNPTRKKDRLENYQIRQFMDYLPIFRDGRNPFPILEEYLLDALGHMLNGQFDWGVISAQTHIEGLLRAIFRNIRLYQGSSIDQVESELEDLSFGALIKREMPNLLGGDWNLTQGSGKVAQWYSNCYQLRNRIVHGGYRPNGQEAERAYIAAEQMKIFVHLQLRKKKQFHEAFNGQLKMS
jgi:hypothetical protein